MYCWANPEKITTLCCYSQYRFLHTVQDYSTREAALPLLVNGGKIRFYARYPEYLLCHTCRWVSFFRFLHLLRQAKEPHQL